MEVLGNPIFEVHEFQQQTIDEVIRRTQEKIAVPSYMYDTLTRMHPLTLAEALEFNLTEEFTEEDVEKLKSSDSDAAWRQIAMLSHETFVPFEKPMHLLSNFHNLEKSGEAKNEIIEVFSQTYKRVQLQSGVLDSSRLVSLEYAKNKDENLKTKEIFEAWQNYQQQINPHYDYVLHSPMFEERIDPELDPEMIIAIPALISQENNILQTLGELAKQSLENNRYEVFILFNDKVPDYLAGIDEPDQATIELFNIYTQMYFDKAVNVLENVISNYPDLNLNAHFAIFDYNSHIGEVRNYLHRLIGQQQVEREAFYQPLLLNLDADITKLNADYLKNILETYEDTQSPVIATRLRWANHEVGIKSSSLAARITRLERAISRLQDQTCGTINYTDCGTAVAFKDYFLSGGHFWADDLAETLNVVHMIKAVDDSNKRARPTVSMSTDAIFSTNPRRQFDVMARGHSPTRSWDDEITTFGESKDQVRTQALPIKQAEEMAGGKTIEWVSEIIERHFNEELIEENQELKLKIESMLKVLNLPSPFAEQKAL